MASVGERTRRASMVPGQIIANLNSEKLAAMAAAAAAAGEGGEDSPGAGAASL